MINTILNKEDHYKAEAKCREARKLVKQASELNDSALMFKAVESYTQAIAIYPRLLEPYLSIAYISLEYKQKNNAIMLLNKALEMDPSNKKAKNLLERAKSLKIQKDNISIANNSLPEKSRIHQVKRISPNVEVKMTELKAVVEENSFNILKELTETNPVIKTDTSVEKIINRDQLTKDKIEQLAKLKNSQAEQIKITLNKNSSFMKLFKK